ncbi:hypothetical protein BH10PSE6_BH10PSE6_06620 [soil metagenome]
MNYSTIARDGAGRDEALKRRHGGVSKAFNAAPKPKPDTEKPTEQKLGEKPAE